MATNKLRSFGALRYHHNKSGFRGVFYDAQRGRWRAEVGYHDGRVRGPWRKSAESAARDYDQHARKRYGDYACLNFPGENELATMAAPATMTRPGFCSFGHDLSVYGYIDPRGRVHCRQCNTWAQARRKDRKSPSHQGA